eukprot:scaffold3.g6441.t1
MHALRKTSSSATLVVRALTPSWQPLSQAHQLRGLWQVEGLGGLSRPPAGACAATPPDALWHPGGRGPAPPHLAAISSVSNAQQVRQHSSRAGAPSWAASGTAGIQRAPPPQRPRRIPLKATAYVDSSSGGKSSSDADVAGAPDGARRLHSSAHAFARSRDSSWGSSLDEPSSGGGAPGGGTPRFSSSSPSPRAGDRARDRAGWEQYRDMVRSTRLPAEAADPSWWGTRRVGAQQRIGQLLESREAHYFVIGLTLLDLGIVITELALSSIFPIGSEIPPQVHLAEEALSWTTIGILGTFTAELFAKLGVFGHRYFTHSAWHSFDAVIVVAPMRREGGAAPLRRGAPAPATASASLAHPSPRVSPPSVSLVLELSLKGVAQEIASLLIFFRLWRIMRLMHGVAEAIELRNEEASHGHQREVAELKKELSAKQERVEVLQQQVGELVQAVQAVQAMREMQAHVASKDRQLAALQEEVGLLAAMLSASGVDAAAAVTAAKREAAAVSAGGAEERHLHAAAAQQPDAEAVSRHRSRRSRHHGSSTSSSGGRHHTGHPNASAHEP